VRNLRVFEICGMNDQQYARGRYADRTDWCSETGSPLPRISVRNLQRKIGVNGGELETFADSAVQRCLRLRKRKRSDLRKLREVFVWLISDRRIAVLHRQFLGKSGPTDVLTFQHGEIFISVETARRHARAFGNSLTRELELYIIHGLLHLQGFDDQTPGEARKMRAAQEKILRAALE
jgi:probable rRNA maturation factor